MAESKENVSPDYTNIYIPDTLLQAVNRSNLISSQSSLGRKMLMVPPLLRQEKNSEYEYDPMVVSLGPYHHGKKELQLAEDFKVKALEMLVADSGKDLLFFYTKVLEVVNDARNCYIDSFTSQYDDQVFAQMMLLDACFIINHVLMGRIERNFYVTTNCLGYFHFSLILRDLILLENQIPFWLVKMLICLGYGKEFGEEMLIEYLNSTLFGDYKQTGMASLDWIEQPFHLLDAFWLLLVSQDSIQTVSRQRISPAPYKRTNKLLKLNKNCVSLFKNISNCTDKKDEENYTVRKLIHSFRSVSELKSRGIHFHPSSGNSLKSIRFKPGSLTSTLEVPIWIVCHYTKGFLLNMIAYELCPNSRTDRTVTGYIEFLKTLIDNPNDVKELREKKILLSTLGNEDVVKVFKELNTYGMGNTLAFQHIKEEIQAHYNRKGNTWLAELIYTYFRTPWTVIALLAATFLLVLTFLQTYFTLNPRNG